jgi:crossover junction endodeoxyribonuclease RuvC
MTSRLHQTRIIGIDPGTNILGYGLIDLSEQQIRVLDCGIIRLTEVGAHHLKLREIYLHLQEIIETYLPSVLAVEAPFYGKNVQSMLKLGRAQGVAIAAGITMGLDIVEYSPKKVKQSVTGNGNAAKEQVAAMMQTLLGYQFHTNSFDASDALAVAYCHYHHAQHLSLPEKHSSGHVKNWKQFLRENPDRITQK